LKPNDQAFWAVLSRFLPSWQQHLTIVQPDTVLRWHRAGWRLYWRWKSKPGPGRPKVPLEVRTLIRQMSLDNRLWGAPRIHGEFQKLGYDICETTISKYMVKSGGRPSQTWQTFIRNHMTDIVAVDFFSVHTAAFKTLYIFLVLSLDRRKIIHFNIRANPNSDWTSLQLLQAFPFDSAKWILRENN